MSPSLVVRLLCSCKACRNVLQDRSLGNKRLRRRAGRAEDGCRTVKRAGGRAGPKSFVTRARRRCGSEEARKGAEAGTKTRACPRPPAGKLSARRTGGAARRGFGSSWAFDPSGRRGRQSPPHPARAEARRGTRAGPSAKTPGGREGTKRILASGSASSYPSIRRTSGKGFRRPPNGCLALSGKTSVGKWYTGERNTQRRQEGFR